LVLLRGGHDDPEVLLGRRSHTARFMPSRHVVPGGRLDRADAQPSGFAEALAVQPPGLDPDTRNRLRPLLRCALREAYEEAGLLLGGPDPGKSTAPVGSVWQAYAAAGVAPDFAGLRVVARAITPTDSPIRFDTRFVLADATTARRIHDGDGELSELAWHRVSHCAALPLPVATRAAIAAAVRLRHALARDTPAPAMARLYWRVGPDGTARPIADAGRA
jgi:8-oxo-dGTP pyrophosphatase MutT (NUDIX family)